MSTQGDTTTNPTHLGSHTKLLIYGLVYFQRSQEADVCVSGHPAFLPNTNICVVKLLIQSTRCSTVYSSIGQEEHTSMIQAVPRLGTR